MDRLTNSATREALSHVTIRKMLYKLTEYEDTGLTPEEVKELQNLYKTNIEKQEESAISMNAQLRKELTEYRSLGDINMLRQIIQEYYV